MSRLALIVPAILAALLGAPSAVSGGDNALLNGQATPPSGTTSTVFTLEVDYVGLFDAVRVEAHVAGRVLDMELSSGVLLDGRWSTSTTLPAGSWPVAFVASAVLGNTATLIGPTLDVAGDEASHEPAEPAPGHSSPSAARSPEAPGSTEPVASAEPASPASAVPEPTAAPKPVAARTPSGGDVTSTDDAAAARATDGGGRTATTPAPSPSPLPSPTAADHPKEGTAAGDTADAAPAGSQPAGRVATEERRSSQGGTAAPVEPPRTDGSAEPRVDDELAGMTVVTMAWLAAFVIALAATFVIVAARRRARHMDAAEALLVADETTALLERRALRRARVHLTEEDPIVAALGIRDLDEPRRRPTERRGRPSTD